MWTFRCDMAIFFAGPADSSRTGDATVYQAAYNRQKVYFSQWNITVTTVPGAWQLLQVVSNYAEYLRGIEGCFQTQEYRESLDTIMTIPTEGGSLYSSTKRTRSQLKAEQREDGEEWENDTQEGSSGKRGRKGKGSAIPIKKRKRAAETQESVFAFDATRMQEPSKDDDDDMDASKRLTPSVQKALRKELRPQGVKLVDDMDEMAAEMVSYLTM
ncbi:hypothetical protein MPER_08352 [Moniliophthora perniciosa FA553]|nr:hypothetical protein MPER_08352 [Moniliophthora perniciosa FA553]